MFRESTRNVQLDIFGEPSLSMCKRATKLYTDPKAWQNRFYELVTSQVDETIFKPLFKDVNNGAPTCSIRAIVGMMVYKAGCGCSDRELEEKSDFDMLLRRALGLFNLNASAPSIDSYYKFRSRLVEYKILHGEDLFAKCFSKLTGLQAAKFNISGKSVRMDSKLIGSNIAWYSRYQLIHTTFCKEVRQMLGYMSDKLRKQAEELLEENAKNVVYTSDQSAIQSKLDYIGHVIYAIITELNICSGLLYRVFTEQYDIVADKDDEGNDTGSTHVAPKDKRSISADSLQNPNDPDAAYRQKGEQRVKGYSANLTETTDEEGKPSLVVDAQVKPATAADNAYVQDALKHAEEVTGNAARTLYSDGAYNSESNRDYATANGIDLVLTGVQGKPSRFELEMEDDTLTVTDKKTGEVLPAERRGDKWRIRVTGEHVSYRYFTEEYLKRVTERKRLQEIPQETRNKRNNVEATIFQYCFHTRNNKTRYRGLEKHRMHTYARCMWMNLVRLVIFQNTLNQRSFFALKSLLWADIERFCRIIGFKTQDEGNFIGFRLSLLKRMAVAYA